MGHTYASVAGWLWSLQIKWDAWAAIGTIGATLVALFLPVRMARREWARQDGIRQADADKALKKLSDAQREACSAVDRVLAYREAAIAMFDSEPVYQVGVQAIKRISLNIGILLDMLCILEVRPELTDGALYSAVSAKRLAEAVAQQTAPVLAGWGQSNPGWSERKAALEKWDELASMVKERSDGVRRHWNLNESRGAAEIRGKYLPLATAIKEARAADSGAPDYDLTTNYS